MNQIDRDVAVHLSVAFPTGPVIEADEREDAAFARREPDTGLHSYRPQS